MASPSPNPDALPIVLQGSKLRSFLMLCVSVLCVVAGIWLIRSGGWLGYPLVVLFGLGAPLFAINLMPSAASLTLTKDGFTYKSVFRSHTESWHHIRKFSVAIVGNLPAVGWVYVEEHRPPGIAPGILKKLSGVEGALQETYGMPAEQLADLMNEILLRHQANGPSIKK